MNVFISYSRCDFRVGDAIYGMLKQHGHEPWIDVHSLIAGPAWQDQISKAIADSECVVILLSRFSSSSLYVHAEFELACKCGKPILFVLIQNLGKDSFQRSGYLDPNIYNVIERISNNIHWIDARRSPLNIPGMVVEWIQDHSLARSGFPPGSSRINFDIPDSIHFTSWSLILINALTLGVYIFFGIWLIFAMLGDAYGRTSLEMDIFNVTFAALCLTVLFLPYYIYIGFMTYLRREKTPSSKLKYLSSYIGIPSISFLFIKILVFVSGFFPSVNVYDPLPQVFMIYICILFGIFIISRWAAKQIDNNPETKFWLPLENTLRSQKKHPLPVLAIPDEPTTEHKDRRSPMLGIISAVADMPFTQRLKKALLSKGIQVVDQDADILTADLVYVVVSPFTFRNEHIVDAIHYLIEERKPMGMFLVQDARIPEELARFQWIDARTEPGEIIKEIVKDMTSGDNVDDKKNRNTTISLEKQAGPVYVKSISVFTLLAPVILFVLLFINTPGLLGFTAITVENLTQLVGLISCSFIQVYLTGIFTDRRVSTLPFLVIYGVLSGLILWCFPQAWELFAWGIGVPSEFYRMVIGVLQIISILLIAILAAAGTWIPKDFVFRPFPVPSITWKILLAFSVLEVARMLFFL